MSLSVLTTGVGSLPFERFEPALRHVFQHYSLPFLPQLPQAPLANPAATAIPPMLREVLSPQMQAALLRRDGTSFIMHLERAANADSPVAEDMVAAWPGLSLFLEHAVDSERLKFQLAGPATALVAFLSDFPDLPRTELEAATTRWLLRLAGSLVRRLTERLHAEILWIWDDVCLTPRGFELARAGLQEFAAALPPQVQMGLHNCAESALRALTAIQSGTWLSFDANLVDLDNETTRHAAQRYVDAGGGFVFGVFDTRQKRLNVEAGLLLAQSAATLMAKVSANLPLVLSGGCGTGLHTLLYEEGLASALRGAAAVLRA